MAGVLIALLIGEVGAVAELDANMGRVLAVSAGILLYVGTHLLQEVVTKGRSKQDFAISWLMLIVGIVISGVLTLWHVHCEDTCSEVSTEAVDAHAGHNH